ncbi:hypothetical protein [Streptomyces fractus]|uniref:hypothetical protein n=1 Tax=Streptomyces fractus TaxID=641806 RepID=UPI003CE94CE5
MFIFYTPEGGETEELNARRLRTSEVQIIERTADMKWDEVRRGLRMGDVTSLRTVAWVLKKRAEPSLRLTAFDPFEDELQVKLDADEVVEFAADVMEVFGDKPDSLAGAFDELRDAAYDREACELAIKEAQAPKDPAPAQELTAVPTDGSETDA